MPGTPDVRHQRQGGNRTARREAEGMRSRLPRDPGSKGKIAVFALGRRGETTRDEVERPDGLEPTSSIWTTEAAPLDDSCAVGDAAKHG